MRRGPRSLPMARRPPSPHFARRDAVLQEGLLRLVPRAEGELLHAPRQVVHDFHQRRLVVPAARAQRALSERSARAQRALSERSARAQRALSARSARAQRALSARSASAQRALSERSARAQPALSPRPGDGARETHSLQTRHLRAALVGLGVEGLQHAITQTPEAA